MFLPKHFLCHLEGDVLVDHGVVVSLSAMLGQHPPALSVGVEQAIPPLLAPHVAGCHIEVSNGLLHSLRIAGPFRDNHRLVQEGNQLL